MSQKRKIKTDTDLGNLSELAVYMRASRTWLHSLKKCAIKRHTPENPACFSGNKSCKQWVMAWMERNRDFKTTLVYPRRPPRQLKSDQPSQRSAA